MAQLEITNIQLIINLCCFYISNIKIKNQDLSGTLDSSFHAIRIDPDRRQQLVKVWVENQMIKTQ